MTTEPGVGFYTAGGTYVALGVPSSETLLSSAIENYRRLKATNPDLCTILAASAAPVASGFREALPDVDPALVTRVGCHLISTIGAQIAMGVRADLALSIATHVLLDLGGHLPTDGPSPP